MDILLMIMVFFVIVTLIIGIIGIKAKTMDTISICTKLAFASMFMIDAPIVLGLVLMSMGVIQ